MILLGAINGAYFIPSDRRLGELAEREIAAAGDGPVELSDEYARGARTQGIFGAITGILLVTAIYLMVTTRPLSWPGFAASGGGRGPAKAGKPTEEAPMTHEGNPEEHPEEHSGGETDEETPEEFAAEIESDPSRAPDDSEVDKLRGG